MECPLLASSKGICMGFDDFTPCNPGSRFCRIAINSYYIGKTAEARKQLDEIISQNSADKLSVWNSAKALGEELEKM